MCFTPCDLSPRLFSYIDMNDIEHGQGDHVLGQVKKSNRNLGRDYMSMHADLYIPNLILGPLITLNN